MYFQRERRARILRNPGSFKIGREGGGERRKIEGNRRQKKRNNKTKAKHVVRKVSPESTEIINHKYISHSQLFFQTLREWSLCFGNIFISSLALRHEK